MEWRRLHPLLLSRLLLKDAIADIVQDAQNCLADVRLEWPFCPRSNGHDVGSAPESPPGASAKARGCSVPRPGTPSSLLMVTIPRLNDGIVWSTRAERTERPPSPHIEEPRPGRVDIRWRSAACSARGFCRSAPVTRSLARHGRIAGQSPRSPR